MCLLKWKVSERIRILSFSVICVGSLLSDFLGSTACLGLIANTISLLFCLIHITAIVIVLPVIQLQFISHINCHCVIHQFTHIPINWSDLPDQNHHRTRIVDATKA